MSPARIPARRNFVRRHPGLGRLGPGLIVTAALALGLASIQPASAQAAAPAAAPAPSPALLTFAREGAQPRVFTRDDLKAMPRHAIVTRTPWHDTRARFEGVKMSDLFRALGIESGAVIVSGLDGYAAAFPVAEAARFEVILADRKDGKPLTVREKGPLFIIYNYDAAKSRIGDQQMSRSVWQVSSMSLR